jgi:hypothetical protein
MSKKRIRRSGEPHFPYGKSVLASGGLILAFILSLAVLADPASGEVRSPVLAYTELAALPLAIVTVFYTEFRFRNKRRLDQKAPRQRSSKSIV